MVVVVPVPSQVIVGRTISKKQMLMSVCTKIGIQLNVKLGGEAWAVEIPVSSDHLFSLHIFCMSDSMRSIYQFDYELEISMR